MSFGMQSSVPADCIVWTALLFEHTEPYKVYNQRMKSQSNGCAYRGDVSNSGEKLLIFELNSQTSAPLPSLLRQKLQKP